MTPKEKANKLCMDFLRKTHTYEAIYGINEELSKQCALIAVDEIINEYNRLESYKFIIEKEYWQEVKTEIEKL